MDFTERGTYKDTQVPQRREKSPGGDHRKKTNTLAWESSKTRHEWVKTKDAAPAASMKMVMRKWRRLTTQPNFTLNYNKEHSKYNVDERASLILSVYVLAVQLFQSGVLECISKAGANRDGLRPRAHWLCVGAQRLPLLSWHCMQRGHRK